MQLPDPTQMGKLSDTQLTAMLDNLFEPCATLNAYLLPYVRSTSFGTYTELIELCRIELIKLLERYKAGMDKPEFEEEQELRTKICKIVSAHPRLGVPKKQTATLSVHSQNEQKSLSAEGAGGEELARQLQSLNAEYEQTFPGLIFVVFVNGRSREEIMKNMRYRIAHSNWLDEVNTAFNAMADIALDRAKKLNAKL